MAISIKKKSPTGVVFQGLSLREKKIMQECKINLLEVQADMSAYWMEKYLEEKRVNDNLTAGVKEIILGFKERGY